MVALFLLDIENGGGGLSGGAELLWRWRFVQLWWRAEEGGLKCLYECCCLMV